MDKNEIITCMKMIQNSFNYLINQQCEKIQNGSVASTMDCQMNFLNSMCDSVQQEMKSIIKLLICRLKFPEDQLTILNVNKAEKVEPQQDQEFILIDENCKKDDQKPKINQLKKKIEQKDKTLNILQSKSINMTSFEPKIQNKQLKNYKKSRDSIFKWIYEQYKSVYDPSRRNKYQIAIFLSEKTGWSVSTVFNIIKKFDKNKKQIPNTSNQFSLSQTNGYQVKEVDMDDLNEIETEKFIRKKSVYDEKSEVLKKSIADIDVSNILEQDIYNPKRRINVHKKIKSNSEEESLTKSNQDKLQEYQLSH